jgi:hypothetical protein
VEHLADQLHARTVVLQPSDPYWDDEPVSSYAAYLKADGYTVVTRPVTVAQSEQSSAYIRGLARGIDRASAYGSTDLEPLRDLQLPCVSIVWDQPAIGCSASVQGYDLRTS